MTDMQVARTVRATATSMGASAKVMLALFEACIVESGMENLNHGDRDSVGVLQQRASQGWPNPMDVPTATRSFVSRAMPVQNNYATAGQLAQAIQRSAFPLKYDAARAQAEALLATTGGVVTVGATTPLADGDSNVFKDINAVFEKLNRKEGWYRAGLMLGGVALCWLSVRSQLP